MRRRLPKPIEVFAADVLELPLTPDLAERFKPRGEHPELTVRVDLDLGDPLVQQVLPQSRRGFSEERRRRGDTCCVVLVNGEPAGWLLVSYVSHRDPWSGLRVRLGPQELYCYDLWIDRRYRRSGAALQLALVVIGRYLPDPRYNLVYSWVDADNAPSQKLLRDVIGMTHVQRVRYARIFDRWGVPLPFSARPRYGPFSRRGRHRDATARS